MQRSFDDLGTPLADVTFVVFDVETTGGSAETCAITEIGAVKYRGGECLGTFQTLVNPGVPIPPEIVYLTGITEQMVGPAPSIDAVLPTFLEFVGQAILVGHNVRFDMAFMQAACRVTGYERLANRFVDTCALARRLLRDEVPDHRLATLARHVRTATRPCHRALDDALATAEVLHFLLERAGAIGVVGLDDLLALPTTAAHPQAAKLKLVGGLPRRPGVYLFRDIGGRVLYVGKATDLRSRVRSYFSSDDRRKVWPLLRELVAIEHRVCATPIEAAVLEVRLIQRFEPRYNRQAKLWRKYVYVKLDRRDRFPRLVVTKAARPGDGNLYLGPISSAAAARLVVEAIESAVPLRRCTGRVPKEPAGEPCLPAQLGVAVCPCSGAIDGSAYAALVDRVVGGLTTDPAQLFEPLSRRMGALASAGRFEEAASTRDRAAALSRALRRQRQLDALVATGSIDLVVGGEAGVRLDHGRLVAAWPAGDGADSEGRGQGVLTDLERPVSGGPVPRHLVDELACVAAWIERRIDRITVVGGAGSLDWPRSDWPRFEPAKSRVA